MLGEQISETKGKRLVRRVLSVNPPTAEVSFEDSGQILGVATTGMGTYTSIVSADGTIHGDGQGMSMTADGEAITWTGTGVGRFGPGGSVSYRGMLFFRTTSQKLARVNGAEAVWVWYVDREGNYIGRTYIDRSSDQNARYIVWKFDIPNGAAASDCERDFGAIVRSSDIDPVEK